MTLTANNASFEADLQRRIVQVRIDAGDKPTHRHFDFCPVSAALAGRVGIAESVCTVLMAYFNDGAPDVVKGDAGGYDDWNRLCRQPVLWLAREGFADALPWGPLDDPAAGLLADPADSDPEVAALGELLRALHALADGDSFTSQQVREWRDAGLSNPGEVVGRVRDALIDISGRADQTAGALGKVLGYRRERTVNGLRLISASHKGSSVWRVVRSGAVGIGG